MVTGAGADAWCLFIHVEASLFLSGGFSYRRAEEEEEIQCRLSACYRV